MEKIKNEDGFNLVVTQCDGCGQKIANLDEAETRWVAVEIKSLSRDEWILDEDTVTRHFCTTECFRDGMSTLDPQQKLSDQKSNPELDDTHTP